MSSEHLDLEKPQDSSEEYASREITLSLGQWGTHADFPQERLETLGGGGTAAQYDPKVVARMKRKCDWVVSKLLIC